MLVYTRVAWSKEWGTHPRPSLVHKPPLPGLELCLLGLDLLHPGCNHLIWDGFGQLGRQLARPIRLPGLSPMKELDFGEGLGCDGELDAEEAMLDCDEKLDEKGAGLDRGSKLGEVEARWLSDDELDKDDAGPACDNELDEDDAGPACDNELDEDDAGPACDNELDEDDAGPECSKLEDDAGPACDDELNEDDVENLGARKRLDTKYSSSLELRSPLSSFSLMLSLTPPRTSDRRS